MTDKPKLTLEQTLLINRLAKDEDYTAVAPLWLSLFGKPVDPTRPAEEIVQEMSDEISSRIPPVKDPKPEPPTFEDMFALAEQVVSALFDTKKSTKT